MSTYGDFSWLQFCERHLIEFVERGPNVGRGNINIRCPFCVDDPSHHMGLSLVDTNWGCWRDSDHAGKNPFRLVARLLGSPQRAAEILGNGGGAITTGWDELAELMKDSEVVYSGLDPVEVPEHFDDLCEYERHPALDYLYRRGYKNPRETAHRFRLFVSEDHGWKGRVILPVFGKDNNLYGWSGRAYAQSAIRYKMFPAGESASSLVYVPRRPKRTVPLLIVEGQFDALAVASVMPRMRVCATMGVSVHSDAIVALAAEGADCTATYVLFDRGAESQAFQLASTLSFLGPTVLEPSRYDDLADHFQDSPQGLKRFLDRAVKNASLE